MRRIFYAIVLSAICVSCAQKEAFVVKGVLNDAAGKTVYMEHFGLKGSKIIDSVKISSKGSFEFDVDKFDSPEFFRLKIDSASYLFAVDSTETVSIKGSLADLQNAELTGSKDAEMLRLMEKRLRLAEDTVRSLVDSFKNGLLADRKELDDKVLGVFINYKNDASKVIFSRDGCNFAASYYVLYKKMIYGMEPFSSNLNSDSRYFYYVANIWKKRYAGSARAAQLECVVKDIRERKETERNAQFYEKLEGNESRGFVNLNLPDANGTLRSLSDLEGKPIFLYFANLSLMSNYDILDLKDLHAKNPGLAIYMVSFEENVEEWKKSAKGLPWICVNDVSGKAVLTYNLIQLPANYLIAANGTVVGRDVRVDDVRDFLKREK